MRRRTFLGLAAALGACLAGAGCAPAPSEGGPSGGPGFDTSRTALCVLETRENIAASRVIFYDGALAELGELRLPYAGLGGSWELPVVHGGVLFVIPEGYQGRKDERKALEIDLSTLGVRVHRIDRVGMYGIAANDDYVYACSNLNGSSYVSRCSRSGGEVVEAEERGVCVDSIALCKDRLCAFATDIAAPDDRPWLYVYDLDLSLVERIDLSAFGKHQFRPLPWGGRVYFPSWSGTSEDAESQVLGSYDPATGATEAFDLGGRSSRWSPGESASSPCSGTSTTTRTARRPPPPSARRRSAGAPARSSTSGTRSTTPSSGATRSTPSPTARCEPTT